MHKYLCLSMQFSTCQYTETFNFHTLICSERQQFKLLYLLTFWGDETKRNGGGISKQSQGESGKGRDKNSSHCTEIWNTYNRYNQSLRTLKKKIKQPYLKKYFYV